MTLSNSTCDSILWLQSVAVSFAFTQRGATRGFWEAEKEREVGESITLHSVQNNNVYRTN